MDKKQTYYTYYELTARIFSNTGKTYSRQYINKLKNEILIEGIDYIVLNKRVILYTEKALDSLLKKLSPEQ